MAKIYADELAAAAGSSTFNSLGNSSDSATSLNSTIDSFISNSAQQLQGEAWDKVRAKLGEYNIVLKEQARVAGVLGEAIGKAVNMLKECLGDEYNYLDSSQLPELESKKTQIAASIESLEKSLYTYEKTEKKDENGNVTDTGTEKVFHEDVQKELDTAKENLKEIEKKIKKIQEMEGVYAQAEAILSAAWAEVEAFRSKASALTPSPIVTYAVKV